MDKASLILSASSFAESDGTLINHEGRAQRFFQVYEPSFYDKSIIMHESWRWLTALYNDLNENTRDWSQLDHVIDACIEQMPHLAGIKDAAPDAAFRIRGQKLAREPHRYSGRTAMLANVSVHEQRQPQDKDTAFAFSMEGNNSPSAPRQQIPFAWAPGWNSPQAWNKFQAEVGGHLRFGDPGVRLFSEKDGGMDYFSTIPAAFAPQQNVWTVAPYYHLFGSEELSQRAPVIQERMTDSYVMLNAQDAQQLNVAEGQILSVQLTDGALTLPVRISTQLTAGQIGLPLGMPGISPVLAGAVVNLQEVAQ